MSSSGRRPVAPPVQRAAAMDAQVELGGTPPGRPVAPAPALGSSSFIDSEPALLLVGADSSFHTAIAQALAKHGVHVETVSAHGVVDAVRDVAPDLILLVGDAAIGGGSAVLAHLNSTPHSSVVPVAILADDSALDTRLRAFRHGAAAVIPRSASVDAIADRVARLAREIPSREGGLVGDVGEATLEDLVGALSKELRSGILSVKRGSGAEAEAVRVVLGGGRPLAATIDEFVARIRKHVVHAEPLEYEFDERAGGTVQLFGADLLDEPIAEGQVAGLRILLADRDAARADAVAQALREHGAVVVVADISPNEQRFERMRQLDPAILLIDQKLLEGDGYKLVARMRRDARLRWASLLVVRWEDIWSEAESTPTVERMLGRLATLAEPEHSTRERIDVGTPFDTRLEITGAARLLRILTASSRALRVQVFNPRVHVQIAIGNNLVAGARAQIQEGDGGQLDGVAALAALMVLSSGRVRIEPVHEPELVNIMATVDVTLAQAEGEVPPLQPSMAAPGDDEAYDAASLRPLPGRSLEAPRRRARALVIVGAGVALAAAVGAGVFVAVRGGFLPALQGGGAAARSAGHAGDAPALQAAPAGAPRAARAASTAALAAAAAAQQAANPPGDEHSDAGTQATAKEPTMLQALPPSDAEGDEVKIALRLESHRVVPECKTVVGATWTLLTGDQPGRALSEVNSGRHAMMVGKLDEAQLAFCRATVFDPTHAASFTSLAEVLLLLRDSRQAREWAERAAKLMPNDQQVLGLYGDTLARVGEVDAARSVWLDAVKMDQDNTNGIRLLALTYAQNGVQYLKGADYPRADRFFRRAALLDTSNATAAAGLGRTLLMQKEDTAALAWAKRSVALEPRDAELRVLLGDAYAKNAQETQAHQEWVLAFALDPGNSRARARYNRVPLDERPK